MERSETENKRYICLVRASDASEGTTSTEAQLTYLKQYAQRMGMIYVDEVVLNSVTGSLPGKRDDLERLCDRKQQKNDFDFVLVQRLDRLTRGGSDHGFWIEHKFKKVGLRIIFVGDDIPDGRYANLIKVAKYESAQEQAFSTTADAIITQLRQMASNVSTMPVFALRQLITSVIEKIFLDMQNKAVEIQLMLPLEMALGGKTPEKAMRLVGNSASSTSDETHPIRIQLGRFDCIEQRIGKPSDGSIKRPCYVCHRGAA